jgi:Fe-S-cluster containining protein
MELEEKVRAVEEVFDKLDLHIAEFQQWSGLGCKWGCGKCCFKSDIEATVLEFLPFAYYLYHNGFAYQWLEKLSSSADPICMILNPLQNGAGMCSEYKHRGLICRLFGFSARTNKYGARELVTCQIIKTDQAEKYSEAGAKVADGHDVPVMNQYYMQLHSIDFQMAQEFFPINEAIKRAVEAILHYYAYRS